MSPVPVSKNSTLPPSHPETIPTRQEACKQFGDTAHVHPQLILYRFLIEEYRVSLFAQKLGTAMTVSEERLNEVWKGIVDGTK